MKAMPTPPPPPTGGAQLQPAEPPSQGNSFAVHAPNAFTETAADRFSTFAVDVDTASYAVSRRYLTQGALPPHAAVRVEEFVNYFKYRYTPPEQGAFTVHLEGAPSPFNANRHFVRVGVQGKVVSRSQRKPAHLVFLVDTSGSMNQQDKLPLAKEAMKIAVKNLNENDTVAIVTYAGSTRDVLSPTPATDLERIYKAIDALESGGGTAMGSGMEMAYKHAVKKASANVVSRVVVLTDGDANIGPNVSADSMLNSIQGFVKEGVTLSAIGFGMGNYRDDLMEKLADKGNGNCFYIDSFKEAKKVFETQLTGTLEVIAKDVKLQVEFDPKVVSRYRLVGYENRDIADKDFRDDKVDAGEIGAGHSVTALYEVELTGEKAALGTVRIRAKTPSGTEAAEQAFPFEQRMLRGTLDTASTDFRFALAAAATADVLRGSPSAQGWNLAAVQKLAEGSTDGNTDREEFVKLVTRARGLLGNAVARDGR
jgi:Ca-activated chloride channel family protein